MLILKFPRGKGKAPRNQSGSASEEMEANRDESDGYVVDISDHKQLAETTNMQRSTTFGLPRRFRSSDKVCCFFFWEYSFSKHVVKTSEADNMCCL